MAPPEGYTQMDGYHTCNASQRFLHYHSRPPDVSGRIALQLSFMASGAIAFAVAAATIFTASIYLCAPDLLGLYPILLMGAIVASAADLRWLKHAGLGAIIGSVMVSIGAYAVGLLIWVPA